jgi:site-specific recombinase XerC
MRVEEWPAPDRAAWEAAHRCGGLLDEDGLAAAWRPDTSRLIASGYGRFLGFLALNGDLDPGECPETRITRRRVEAYVTELRRLNHSSTVAGRILQLLRAASVMAPDGDWVWLRRIKARLMRMATPAHDDRARLLPAATLLDLGRQLMGRAEDASTQLSDRRRALLFRDGLMICLLLACPLRARNMAGLAASSRLQRRGDEWWVSFAPAETKNKRPIDLPLPAAYSEAIERYLDRYRPILLRRAATPATGDALWISGGGQALTAKEVGQRISAVTARELGRDINPHLFRKIATTHLAIHDPRHVGVAQPLLGHADYRVTEGAYNLARSIDAARRHHGVVRAIRAEAAATRLPAERALIGKDPVPVRRAMRPPRAIRRRTL